MPAKKPGVPKQPRAAKHVRVTIGDSNADFQGKLLSAMRLGFGGHLEKSAEKGGRSGE